jgi:hypothetical protein
MANRFFVPGGDGNWSSTTNWSTSSGGGSGASHPTSSDDAIFDANSGSGTAVIDTFSAACFNLNCTGFTGTLSSAPFTGILSVSGSLTFGAGMTVDLNGTALILNGAGSATFTSAGKSIGCAVIFEGASCTLQDDFNCSVGVQLVAGTLDANGHNFTADSFIYNSGTAAVLNMGSGTWTTATFNISHVGLTLNAGTSTLVMTSSLGGVKVLQVSAQASAGTVTLYNVTLAGSGSGGFQVETANSAVLTIAGTVRVLCTGGQTVNLFNTTGITVNNLDCTGATVTLSSSSLATISGSLTLDSGVTLSWSGDQLFTSSGAATITSAGKSFSGTVEFLGSGSWALQDDLATTGQLQVVQGSLLTNGRNVTCSSFSHVSASTATLGLSSGTLLLLTGTGTVWDASAANLTVVPGSSTIKINDSSSSAKTFIGNNKTYSNLWFTGGGTGRLVVTGSNTFANLKVDSGQTIALEDGSLTTVQTLTTSGATMTKQTSAVYQLVITGGRTFGLNHMTIDHCDCLTVETFFAGALSTDGGNNTNVIFSAGFAPVRRYRRQNLFR